MFYKSHRPHRGVSCKRSEEEPIVQNGLAVTPSQMQELSLRGVAVSAQNAALAINDGAGKYDYHVPLEYTRGFDAADAYCAEQEARAKFRNVRRRLDKGELQPVKSSSNE